MAKVKAEVVRCIIDGKRHGEIIEVNEGVARKYEALGYVRNIQKAKKASAPKKPKVEADDKEEVTESK